MRTSLSHGARRREGILIGNTSDQASHPLACAACFHLLHPTPPVLEAIVLLTEKLLESLRRFPRCLEPLVKSLSVEDARWKPASGDWSVLEVVCHLRDEEVEDFRTRLHLTLHAPGTSWPRINPPQAAIDRRYNEISLSHALQSFLEQRQQSLDWLGSLRAPNWESRHEHPHLGTISAGDLLASWSAHDWLHLRQISKRLFEMSVDQAQPYSTRYAGDW